MTPTPKLLTATEINQLENVFMRTFGGPGAVWPVTGKGGLESMHLLCAQAKSAIAYLELLRELTDHDPCHYDHHGYCQAHSLDEKPCPHERAQALLKEQSQ